MTHPIEVVNLYRQMTGKAYPYAKVERNAKKFIEWCERNDADPLRFMKARIYLAKEGDRPVPAIGAMASKALLENDAWQEIFDRAEAVEFDRKFVLEEAAQMQDRYIASLLACTPANEQFKLNHQNQRNICMHDRRFSGGYHPKSELCTSCPIAGQCATAVNVEHGFDVITLRKDRGHIGYVKVP